MSAISDPGLVDAVTEVFKSLPVTGDLKPRGVKQCTGPCPDCGGQCRWGTDHEHNHECLDGHSWSDAESAWDDNWNMLYRVMPSGEYKFALSDDNLTVRAGTQWMSQDEASVSRNA